MNDNKWMSFRWSATISHTLCGHTTECQPFSSTTNLWSVYLIFPAHSQHVQHWRDSIYMTMNTFYCCTGYFVVVSISQNTSKFIDIIVCFYNKFLNSWRMRPQMCSEKHGLSTSIRGLWNVWIPVVFEHINENSYWPYTRKYCTRSDFDCNERKLILSNIFLNFSLMLVLIDGWISISYEQ